jgi:quercetin dioxygenase-like cupin family protein
MPAWFVKFTIFAHIYSNLKQIAMLQSHLFQKEHEIEWEDLGNGIQRQVFGYDERIMLVKAKFEKGAVGDLHAHHHTQVTYVASGVFEMTIGEEVRIIKQGDGYYVPPHVIHGCICLEPGTLVDSFTPHREDFL